MGRKRKNLSFKIIIRCVIMAAVICIAICISGYLQYRNSIYSNFNSFGYQLGEVALGYIDGDRVAGYAQTGETDEAYEQMARQLYSLYSRSGITSVYICIPNAADKTVTTIYDARIEEAENPAIFALGVVDPIGASADTVIGIYQTGQRAEDYFVRKNSFGYNTSAILPVRSSTGAVTALLVVDIPMLQIRENLNRYLLNTVIITIFIVMAFVVLLHFMIKKQIIDPIDLIAGEADAFVKNENYLSENLGNIQTRDEVQVLAQSILQMEKDIKSYVENLTAVTAEKERIGAELDVATKIQASMLPCIFPAFPDREEFDIHASMTPAREVGGDFYDFFMVDEDNLAIVVADVSGKGIPAALFMVIGKTLIKDHVTPGKDLGQVFTEVNDLLCEANSEELFITAFVGVLNLRSGEFRYVNAGHELPFISRRGEAFAPHKIRAAFVLAGMDGMKYKAGVFQLEPGDKIFQYTDGVTEATDQNDQLFGMERLQQSLSAVSTRAPREILEEVKRDIDRFVGDAPQFDDITMLCLEFKKRCGDNPGVAVSQPTLEAVPELTAYLERTLEKEGAPMAVVTRMDIALDEIYSNIVKFSGAGFAKITCGVENGNTAYLIFADDGTPYNPLEQPDPDITLSAEERDIGGLGVFMVKKSMSEISYEYAGGINHLTLKLRF